MALALLLGGFAVSAPTHAATAPRVAVIVGPSGSATSRYKTLATAAAAKAAAYGASVVKVYSPNATWARVKAAAAGASIVLYYGRGRGYPSPYSTSLVTSFEDGFGLNLTAGNGNTRVHFYGESYARQLALAPNALVLLHGATFAPGNGDTSAQPSLTTARRRIDNYGAGFLAAGASAVIAERSLPTAYYLRGVFAVDQTLDALWRHAPTRHGHVKSFASTRHSGSTGRLDPVNTTSGYTRSIVGHVTRSTVDVRGGGRRAAPTPTPAPTAATPVTPAPTSAPSSGAPYGPALGADSLNNSVVGGSGNRRVAYRFRAATSSSLSWVRIYLQSGSGYSGGTGGAIQVSVQGDDGTAAHRPSGSSLASVTIRPGNPISIGNLPQVSFASPARLTAGTLYHLVFTNVDASPTTNFVSVNGLFTYNKPDPWQPKYANTDWANLVYQSGAWSDDRGSGAGVITPILALGYASGMVDGVGYMETWPSAARTVSGSNRVREVFTVSGSSRTVSSVSVRLRRLAGSGALTVRLEDAAGTAIESGTIPASSVTTGSTPAWATYTFATRRTLASGQGYHLVLSAPADTSYSVHPIRKGTTYGFPASTYFADGAGQVTSGSGWTSFTQPGGTNGSQGDLQLVFR